MALKQKNGVPVWHNRIAWALAYLVMWKAIVLKEAGVYRIEDHGRDILNALPSDLTLEYLRSFRPPEGRAPMTDGY